MNHDLIHTIERPDDLRALSSEELELLAQQIRVRMIEATSKTGGHLASSLGTVEIILALHRVFDFSYDRLVFDVGHQSYAHKIITGRNAAFDTLRQKNGLSGFPKRSESPYDAHDAGHASDSLSIACGLATARDLSGRSEQIVTLIGDASLSGGMAFEALNQIGHDARKMIIVLNDNEMSISKTVGALSLYLGKARMSKPYTFARDTVESGLEKTGRVGRALVTAGEAAKSSVKKLMVPGTFFEDMGIKYIGPIDGHNLISLTEALEAASQDEGPVLIHAVTKKGKGYTPAEELPELYHGVGCYDPETGMPIACSTVRKTYTEIFGNQLAEEAALNQDIVAITAGMTAGTGLVEFKKCFPERFIDVGIAEEHAVALAAGLALGGKRPVVAIYSTFLQRAYDQVAMDVALQNQPVIFCVDRAGLVGEDGATHQGAFDLIYLRSIPQMRIIAPYTTLDMQRSLRTALAMTGGPVAIRYPRSQTPAPEMLDRYNALAAEQNDGFLEDTPLPLGKAQKLMEGSDVSLLAIGNMVPIALDCAEILSENGFSAQVVDMIWVKPLDTEVVRQAAEIGYIVTLENGSLQGGFGSAVMEELVRLQMHPRIETFGLPDRFIEHGSQDTLLTELELTPKEIAWKILQRLKTKEQE